MRLLLLGAGVTVVGVAAGLLALGYGYARIEAALEELGVRDDWLHVPEP